MRSNRIIYSCIFHLTALHCRHETSPFAVVVGWVFVQLHCTIHHVGMSLFICAFFQICSFIAINKLKKAAAEFALLQRPLCGQQFNPYLWSKNVFGLTASKRAAYLRHSPDAFSCFSRRMSMIVASVPTMPGDAI